MSSLLEAAAPKSDQLNACDFLVSPKTYTIKNITVKKEGEQKVSVFFEECALPWKPCKSMLRVMMKVWGSFDSKDFIGKRLTLFNDDKVMWAGVAVGGIRISHMSHITAEFNIALRTTRKTASSYIVKPLDNLSVNNSDLKELQAEAGKTTAINELALPEGVSKEEFADIKSKFMIEACEIRHEYDRGDADESCIGDTWIKHVDSLNRSWYALCDKYTGQHIWFKVPQQWADGMPKLVGERIVISENEGN